MISINNNSGAIYTSLNKRNLHKKSLISNFKSINSINNNLRRKTRYIPLFKNNMKTNINKLNYISNNIDKTISIYN